MTVPIFFPQSFAEYGYASHALFMPTHSTVSQQFSNLHLLPNPICNSLQLGGLSSLPPASFFSLGYWLTLFALILSNFSMSLNLILQPIYFFFLYHFSLALFSSFHWYSRIVLWILYSIFYPCYSIQLSKAFILHLLKNNTPLKLLFYS